LAPQRKEVTVATPSRRKQSSTWQGNDDATTPRAVTTADLPSLVSLLRELDRAETGGAFTTEADVGRILNKSRTLADDSYLLQVVDGPAGFAVLDILHDRKHVRANLGVHPDHVAAAPTLLAWVEQRTQQIADKNRWRTTTALTWQLPGALIEPALCERDWKPVRRFSHLTRSLNSDLTVPALAQGVSVNTAEDDHVQREVHAVLEAAMAGHWEHRAQSPEHFLDDEHAATGYDPSLWYLARVGGQPAAAVIARQLPDQGWIGWVGTHPDCRGRGLARLLVLKAMTELRRRDSTRVALDLDTGNTTGALRLYESVGMSADYTADQWRHEVPSAN